MNNILVIIADDMRWDHLDHMPNVRELIQQPGRTFLNARCNVALCQPNRVGFMTGQLSLHHGELDVGFRMPTFTDHDDTIGAWMSAAGYRCGMLGKYINFWDSSIVGGIDAPTGWATWREMTKTTTANTWAVHEEAGRKTIVGQYQTDYLADQFRAFVGGGGPWFCYLAPPLPHAPFSPHPRDLHAWSQARCRMVPVVDSSDKPPWVDTVAPLDDAEWSLVQQSFRGRLRELSAVDHLVGEVVSTLEATGLLDSTTIYFTSDNGVHQGEQRRRGDGTKGGPYDVGLRVPFVARGPGFPSGPDVETPVYPMQDLTASLIEAAGAVAGLPHQAGTSLQGIVATPGAHASRTLLHEIGPLAFDATGDGITTGPLHELGQYKLFRYPSARDPAPPHTYELYDLVRDPDELVNLADRPEAATTRAALEQRLDALLQG